MLDKDIEAASRPTPHYEKESMWKSIKCVLFGRGGISNDIKSYSVQRFWDEGWREIYNL